MLKNMSMFLGEPILVELEENTYNKKLFKGLYLNRYKLKDFINKDVGEELYLQWCSSICTTPKDVADILWVQCKTYYKEMNDWSFIFGQCFNVEKQEIIKSSYILNGLKFMFGYDFIPTLNYSGKTPEEVFFFNIYDDKGNWLAKINYNNFEKIREVIRLVNAIKPTELSTWNFAYDKHEKKALKYYYEKNRNKKNKKDEPYDFTLETVLRFLKCEIRTTYKELFDESLCEIYACYSMKSSTFQALALNIGIYGGNLKMDSSVKNNLLFGVVHNEKQARNLASGNNTDIVVETQE